MVQYVIIIKYGKIVFLYDINFTDATEMTPFLCQRNGAIREASRNK